MNKLRLSVHSAEHVWLRKYLLDRRLELQLSQRALAQKLGVIHSFVGKVETGDRRLDIFEFIAYCEGLEIDPIQLLQAIHQRFGQKATQTHFLSKPES